MSTDNGPSPDHTDGSSNCVSGVLAYVGIGSFVGLAFFFAFYYIKSVLINRHERRPSPLVSLVTAPDVDNTRESRNLGLDLGNISLLPTFPYQPIKRRCRKERHEHRENVSTVECVVCLGELEEGEMVRVLPVCKHYFHVNCIDMWLSTWSSCPMCRAHPEPEKVSWDWCRFHHLGVMIYCTKAHQIEDILVTARHDTFNCSLDHGTARDQNHRMLVTARHVFCTLDAS